MPPLLQLVQRARRTGGSSPLVGSKLFGALGVAPPYEEGSSAALIPATFAAICLGRHHRLATCAGTNQCPYLTTMLVVAANRQEQFNPTDNAPGSKQHLKAPSIEGGSSRVGGIGQARETPETWRAKGTQSLRECLRSTYMLYEL